ncbi:MAG: DsbA family protein [Gemmatimonadota bacterium]
MSRNRRERAESRAKTNGPVMIIAVIAIVGAAALAWSMFGGGGAATEIVEFAEDEAPDPQELIQLAQGILKGDADAPVQIIEFADYQCPGCRAFATNVLPTLQSYIDAGSARLTFYDFPLTNIHQHAVLAARAARCAGDQDSYWAYHDVLFGRQPVWSAERRATDEFVEYAGLVGLDQGNFEACLQSDRFATEVSASVRLGQELRVSSTPTVFVNGTRAQPATEDAVRALIDAALER